LLNARSSDHRPPDNAGEATPASGLVDSETFTVHWKGKTCHLGYTVPFRVIDVLARHANHFIPHPQLLDEVWGGARSASAVRSAVSDLRARLIAAGMKDLALAIDGHNTGHYGFLLGRIDAIGTSD
jgi:DNA-binding response OmpR family regulator